MINKTIAVSTETHYKLIKIKSYLDERHSKLHSMNDVITFLTGVFHDE